MKTLSRAVLAFFVVAGVAYFALQLIRYQRPPRVTLINATGGEVFEVELTHGEVVTSVPALRNHFAATVEITSQFGESATSVSWSDSSGRHSDTADDYVEHIGIYHSRILLTPDGRAEAVVVLE